MPNHNDAWRREREDAEKLEKHIKLLERIRDVDEAATKIKYRVPLLDSSPMASAIEIREELGKLIRLAANCLDLLP